MGSFIPLANNREKEAALPAEEQNDSSLKYEPILNQFWTKSSAFTWDELYSMLGLSDGIYSEMLTHRS